MGNRKPSFGLMARLGQQENTWQDAQKRLAFSATRPWRAKTRLSQTRPQRVKARGVPMRYVEGLNDARTKLADFFSILFSGTWRSR